MKRIPLLIVALLGGVILALTLALLMNRTTSVRASPSVRYVAPGGNCNGASPCYGGVQAAVDAAAPGDEIRVAAGTYTDVHVRSRDDITTTGVVTQVVYISKTLTVRGGYTTTDWTSCDPENNPTILDAQGQGRVLYIIGDISPVVEGLRITGGDATGMGGLLVQDQPGFEDDAGGGIYAISVTVTISKSRVFNNVAGRGGGVYLGWSPAVFISNTISANSATNHGGGIFLDRSPATFTSNVIASNAAGDSGGGIRVEGVFAVPQEEGTGYLSGNTVISNTAGQGGGLFLFFSKATLERNTIMSNTAGGSGGGVHLFVGDDSLDGNIVIANNAERGGGLFIGSAAPPELTNNVIMDNQASIAGSGVFIVHSLLGFAHNTIANNSGDGAGVYIAIEYPGESNPYPSDIVLTNTIMVSHSIGISVTGNSTVTLNGILWYNTPITVSQSLTATVSVQNQISGSPAFAADGYHITPFSAAMDEGVDAGVTTDLDGHLRPYNAIPDLGADEIIATYVSTGTSSSLVYTDTQGLSTAIEVPGGAVTDVVWLSLTPILGPLGSLFDLGSLNCLDLAEQDAGLVGFTFAGRAFDLEVYRDGELLSGFAFSLPITVTLHYTDTDVADLDEDTLLLAYWNEDTSEWKDAINTCTPPLAYDRHPNANWVAVPICHLTRFALVGREEYVVYLPLVLRNH